MYEDFCSLMFANLFILKIEEFIVATLECSQSIKAIMFINNMHKIQMFMNIKHHSYHLFNRFIDDAF